jgi:hypothetical protein
MIPYVEIIKKDTLKKISMVEPSECWAEISYNDIGEAEIYAVASNVNMQSLIIGNYVKLPNKPYIWVITSINYTYVEGVPMISAKCKEAKWLLYKRVIQEPLELPNKVALAVEQLVYNNLGAGAAPARVINGFTVAASGLDISLTDTQAARANLLDFVTNLLKTYNLGFTVIYQNESLIFKVIQGQDISQSVRFSQSLDNLLESSYLLDDSNLGTNALVVSTVDNVDYPVNYDLGKTGVDRSEILIKSNLSTEYTPNGATDPVKLDLTVPADKALYESWLYQEGRTSLNDYVEKKAINSTLDLANSLYEFENDYNVGDIVGIIDDYFNYDAKARIIKITINQNANGYGEEAEFKEV